MAAAESPEPPHDAGPVCVARVYSVAEWSLVRSCLEAYGFVVFETNMHFVTVGFHYATATDGIGIYVPATQAKDAMLLLADIGTPTPAPTQTPPPVKQRWWQFRLRHLGHMLLWLMFGVAPPRSGSIYYGPAGITGSATAISPARPET